MLLFKGTMQRGIFSSYQKGKTFEFFVHQFLGIFLLARADSGEKATKLLVILLVEQKVSML